MIFLTLIIHRICFLSMKKIIFLLLLVPLFSEANLSRPLSEYLKAKYPEIDVKGTNCRVAIRHYPNIVQPKVLPTFFQLSIFDMNQTTVNYMLTDMMNGGRGDCPNVIRDSEHEIFVMNQTGVPCSSYKVNHGGFEIISHGRLTIYRVYSKEQKMIGECQVSL